MRKLQSGREVNRLTILLAATYMISYMTRINYGAIISEMERATAFSRSLLSMALTGSFITYGVGQIISGICGDRFSPKKLVSYGLIVTVCMNLLIPFCVSPYQMLVVWCINGFAQSFMWPPLVRMMSTLLSDEDYKKTTTKVSWGSSVGSIVVYLISPLIISLAGWKFVFWFMALCGVVMIFIWNRFSYEIDPVKRKHQGEEIRSNRMLFTPLMIGIMAVIALQGMLRDGVTTWMPSYISETYQMSNVAAILSGVVLPVFSILSFQLATTLYVKRFKDPISCGTAFFGAGAFSALALLFITGRSAVFSLLLSAILTGCMHGVNLMLICMIPPYFYKYGNVSTVSGVLNSCTYIGSAISTYGIAVISENKGWNFTLGSWLLIAVAGTVIGLICIKGWREKFK